MPKPSPKVMMLHARDSDRALENLNRITGLRFSRWPESLVTTADHSSAADDKPPHETCEVPARASQALA
ncbi:hypothetical protein M1D96_15515 [Pseudomonas sp. D1-3]|uniref:hypothetical protein n=1 Tax=Phytopseudomonas argentinensis TaxID=289370 RepID=UPI0008A90BF4|nr:hypothetical protein [Pseudomonas argentinensis]